MATIKELFINSVNEGLKAAEMIVDSGQKAQAYAAIASALAETGLISGEETTGTSVTPKEALKPETSKGKAPVKKEVEVNEEKEEKKASEKPKAAPKKLEIKKSKKEDTVEEELDKEEEAFEEEMATEEEITADWTEETYETFSKEIEFISYVSEKYGDEFVEDQINTFSEGLFRTMEAINPLNIRGLCAFLEAVLSDIPETQEEE